MPISDNEMTYEQRCDAVMPRLRNLAHLVDGMDSGHAFYPLAMKLAKECMTIIEEGFAP